MEDINNIESLIKHVKQYAETRYDLFLINTQDKLSNVIASAASVLMISVLGLFMLLFLSIGVAWYIGEQTENPAMGFFSLAGFYLVVTLVVYLAREKWIKIPIINAIIKKITIHE